MSHIVVALVVAIVFYQLGWGAAHHMVARECRQLGKFFVGSETFKCVLIESDDQQAPDDDNQ